MIFNKKVQTTVLMTKDSDNIRRLDIYKTNGKTFQLFCDVKKSDGTIGVNNNYAASILGLNGFTLVVDNRTLGIPEVKMSESAEIVQQKIEAGFKKFKEFADSL